MRKPRWRTDEDGIAALAAFVREEVPLVDEATLQLEHAEGEEADFVARLAQHAAKNPALVVAYRRTLEAHAVKAAGEPWWDLRPLVDWMENPLRGETLGLEAGALVAKVLRGEYRRPRGRRRQTTAERRRNNPVHDAERLARRVAGFLTERYPDVKKAAIDEVAPQIAVCLLNVPTQLATTMEGRKKRRKGDPKYHL